MRLGEVLGQAAAARLVGRLLARGALTHALALIGQPGCGRRTFARALAGALVCERPAAGDGCGACQGCRLAAEGAHPDILALPNDRDAPEHDDDGNLAMALPMARIQALVEAAATSPLMARGRVFIVPAAERLSAMQAAAGNALLKLIEEPPPGAHLILTAASRDGLMPTIRSRVQCLRLADLGADEVAAVLVGRGMDPEQARLLAGQANGSHRHLEAMHRGEAPVEPLLHLASGNLDLNQLGACLAALPGSLSAADRAAGRSLAGVHRAALQGWLGAVRARLRQRLRQGDAGAAAAIERIAWAERDLRINLNVRIVLESMGLGLQHPQRLG